MKFLFTLLFIFTTIFVQAQITNCKQHTNINFARENSNTRSIASQNFDVKFYNCFFENTPNVRTIKGFVTTYFKMLSSGNNITFDLKNNLIVDSVRYHNANTTFSRSGDAVQVNFSTAINTNAIDSVTIYYQGTPLTTEGYFATGTHSGAPITYTLSEPYGARYWWPCKDDVVDKADSIQVTLKYPNTYTGVANGLLIRETNNGTNKTSVWKHRKPIAAYLMAFAISNYVKDVRSLTSNGSPMPFINYYYPESATSYNNNVNSLTTAFNLFEQKFGPYPFNDEAYMQTQIQAGVGGMEHQTNSFIDSWGAGLGAHELMHQWFGDKVTCNTWKDIWLNEGFASYGEVMYTEAVNGASAVVTEMKARANSINNSINGTVYCNDTSSVGTIFNYRLSYLKASYIVHMLRYQLGDAAFYQACRNYLNAPGISYSFATTDSLKKYMEVGLTGGGNLTEFFNDFVYNAGYPSYTIEWNQVGNNVIVKANQTSANASVSFYEMPIPVKFIGASRDTTIRFTHTSSGQIFNFPLNFTVTNVQFDSEAWILSKNNSVNQNTALAPTAINNIVIDNKITLGPIPVKNYFSIYNKSNRIIKQVEVWNMQGQKMITVTSNFQLITIQNLHSGKYIVKIIDNKNNKLIYSLVK